MASLKSRIVVHDEVYDGTGFTDQNSLVRALADKPDELTPVITMLMGAWNYANQFPLLALTEGQGFTRNIGLNDIQYTYPVMGKRKTTDTIVSSTYSASSVIGNNKTDVVVVFANKWFSNQQLVMTPNKTLLRVNGNPIPVGKNWRYTFKMVDPDPTVTLDFTQVLPGTAWGAIGGAPVSESRSWGNESVLQSPGKRKNQISILRRSYHIAGNISNKIVEFQLFNSSGQKTNYWLDWAEFQHMLQWREDKETHLWVSEYTRDAAGQNPLIDPDTGQIIPMGAGLMQQITNSDTFTTLTEAKIRSIVSDVFRGVPDTGAMDIVVYCGEGFAELFDIAMKSSTSFTLVADSLGDKFVRSAGGNLQLGGYFTSYLHIDGHIITLKRLQFLTHGAYADVAPRHPETGLPLTSYEAYFVDQSIYDGVPNLQMVHQKGRMEIRGLEQGMSLVKGSEYGSYSGNSKYLKLATQQDQTSIHFLGTCGIQMLNDTHSFKLLPSVNIV